MVEDKILIEKTTELSGFIENNLESTFNILVHSSLSSINIDNIDLSSIYDNKVENIKNEINERIITIFTDNKNKKPEKRFYEEILKLNSFAFIMQNIYTLTMLIKHNIREIAKYPLLNKQAYIPDVALMTSATVKNCIDAFYEDDDRAYNKLIEEIKNIRYLNKKILNELAFTYDTAENKAFDNNKNPSIYYAVIVSYIEAIAMQSLKIIKN